MPDTESVHIMQIHDIYTGTCIGTYTYTNTYTYTYTYTSI